MIKEDEMIKTILLHQCKIGGWPKNYDRTKLPDKKFRRPENDLATIDNGATYTEIKVLAQAQTQASLLENDDLYIKPCLRGINYLLEMQYDNGGWPQKYPRLKNYWKHITFNDDAMINVMILLKDIYQDRERVYSFVPNDIKEKCHIAVEKGIECILKCQIKIKGKLTAWCAQHDYKTLKPTNARSYELASISGRESVKIVNFLMDIENPNKRIKKAIQGAIEWFERSKITGVELVTVEDANSPTGQDKILVKNSLAGPVWGRFYDLKTNQPFFCSRDGIPKATIAEISHERRNGYSWYGRQPEKSLKKYFEWQEKIKSQQRFSRPRFSISICGCFKRWTEK